MTITKQHLDRMTNQPFKNVVSINTIYRGKVVDNNDPDKRGKVLVWIPDLMIDNVEDFSGVWALPGNVFFSGNKDSTLLGLDDCGSCLPPPKDSYVMIWFEDGDANKPYYIGGLCLDVDESVPIEQTYGSNSGLKWTPLKTPAGRQIFISDDSENECVIVRGKYVNRSDRVSTNDPRKPDDSMYLQLWEKQGQEFALLKDGMGQYILLDKANNRLRLQHSTGSFIEFNSNGDIVIQSKNKVYINCNEAYYEER